MDRAAIDGSAPVRWLPDYFPFLERIRLFTTLGLQERIFVNI